MNIKILFISATLLACSHSVFSQLKKHEIGVRTQMYAGRIMPGLQYIHNLNERNQLDFSANFMMSNSPIQRYVYTSLSAYYRWKFNIKKGLYWQTGLGLIGEHGYSTTTDHTFYYGAGAQLGLLYDFNKHDIPLVIGADIRPELMMRNGNPFFRVNSGISLRYTF